MRRLRGGGEKRQTDRYIDSRERYADEGGGWGERD